MKKIVILAVAGAFSFVPFVFAQDVSNTGTPAVKPARPYKELNKDRMEATKDFNQKKQAENLDKRKDVKDSRMDTKAEIRKDRVDLHMDIDAKRRAFRAGTSTPEKRMELHKGIMQDRKAFQTSMHDDWQAHMITVQARRESAKIKIEQGRTALKGKLNIIKDERKKLTVERLDSRMEVVHDKTLDHFNSMLVNLTGVLGKVDTRADKAFANGKDTAQVESAVTKARGLIDTAKTLVAAAESKTYPVIITTETKLGTTISAVRKTMHDDLKKLHDSVKSAREAVKTAVEALKAIPGINDEPTSTATTTPAR